MQPNATAFPSMPRKRNAWSSPNLTLSQLANLSRERQRSNKYPRLTISVLYLPPMSEARKKSGGASAKLRPHLTASGSKKKEQEWPKEDISEQFPGGNITGDLGHSPTSNSTRRLIRQGPHRTRDSSV
eukprot:gene10200-18877_t